MNYLGWSLLALVAYSAVPALVSYSLRDIPTDVVALVTNGLLVVGIGLVLVVQGQAIAPYLGTGNRALAMYLAGGLLAVGIIAYYRALALGPVSVVVPVFAMFLVGASVVGVLFFQESLTARKLAGIGFAVLAVYLTAVE